MNLINSNDFISEYKKKIDEITEMYYKSEKERDSLQLLLKDSDEVIEKIIKSSNTSSNHLENHNKLLLKDIKDLQDELKFYKLQQSEEKIDEQYTKSFLEKKNEKISKLKAKIENLEKDFSNAKNEISELSKRITVLQNDKEKLELELVDLKCKSIQALKLERTRIDEIDMMLEKYFSDQNLENLFVKISTGLYVYGTKKVNVLIKSENLICRVGGGYLLIDEFIKQEQFNKSCRRCLSNVSPLNSGRNSFIFPSNHCKTNSLISHLVSPKQRTRMTMSFDIENIMQLKTIEENFKLPAKVKNINVKNLHKANFK